MEVLRQPELLRDYLDRFQIREMFDTQDLHFRLFQYSKGERLLSPIRKMEHLLFLVEGTVYIYGLRQDAGYSPLVVHTPLTIYGDVEFATQQPGGFFVEAQSSVRCVALPFRQYEETLRADVRFLNTLLRFLGEKLAFASSIETSGASVEEQVLFYLENFCADGCIHSVNETFMRLHCSRRQLQRALSRLCSTGQIERVGKGCYRLIACNR